VEAQTLANCLLPEDGIPSIYAFEPGREFFDLL
jgi:hypothetical protein